MDPFLFLDSTTSVNVMDNSFMKNTTSVDDIVPEDCTLTVKQVDGLRQGKGMIKTKKGIVYARLNYQDDKLSGHCTFNDIYGKKRFDGYYEDGVKNGWGCEYDDNRKPVFFGFYKDGQRYHELVAPDEEMAGYYAEISGDDIYSVCQYDKNWQKDGICFIYQNNQLDRISLFENGLEMQTLKEFTQISAIF